MVETTDSSSRPDQDLLAYRKVYSLVEGPELMAYTGYWDTDNAVRQNRAIWLKKYQEVAKQEPLDFTTIDLLYDGGIEFGDFSVDFGSWRKPGKMYSGDLVYARILAGDSNHKGALLGVCADGVTMLIKPEELPQRVREICTYQTSSGPVFAPDHLWSAFMSRVFFEDDKLPVAPEFQKLINRFLEERVEQVFPFRVAYEAWYMNNDESEVDKLWENVFECCQRSLREFYAFLFGEEFLQNQGVAGMLPSGVMSVFKLEKDGQFDYAYTGDVDVIKISPYKHEYKVLPYLHAVSLTKEKVSPHDQTLDVVGQDKRDLVKAVATERIADTGNITGVVEVLPSINSVALKCQQGIVMRTDGERLVWNGQLGRMGGFRKYLESSRGDVGAVLLYSNPFLYQCDLIATQRRWRRRREDKYDRNKAEFKRKWRADDASWLRIRRQERE